MLMVHGRGAQAHDILTLADQLAQPGFVYFAPQAAGNSWYPNRFLVPFSENEPWLTSALTFIGDVFAIIAKDGIPPERTILLGFSQGACLALEYAARNARRYGGLVGLSGALIGPEDAPRDYAGSLQGTPVFLGCGEVDVHIPKERVQSSADVLRKLGGSLTERYYPDLEHTTNPDELDFVRGMMRTLLSQQ
jgi:predicted esterase